MEVNTYGNSEGDGDEWRAGWAEEVVEVAKQCGR